MQIRTCLGALFALAALVGTAQAGWTQTIVKGIVNDAKGSPLNGVLVEVWRGGRVNDTRTLTDGTYELKIEPSATIDQIRYSRSDLDPAVIAQLTGTRNQEIGKVVLFATGAARSLSELDEQLHAFEAILIHAWTSPAQSPAIGRLRELNPGKRVAALPVPTDASPGTNDLLTSLRNRKEALVKLYDARGMR